MTSVLALITIQLRYPPTSMERSIQNGTTSPRAESPALEQMLVEQNIGIATHSCDDSCSVQFGINFIP